MSSSLWGAPPQAASVTVMANVERARAAVCFPKGLTPLHGRRAFRFGGYTGGRELFRTVVAPHPVENCNQPAVWPRSDIVRPEITMLLPIRHDNREFIGVILDGLLPTVHRAAVEDRKRLRWLHVHANRESQSGAFVATEEAFGAFWWQCRPTPDLGRCRSFEAGLTSLRAFQLRDLAYSATRITTA
jgi:hypothetical protein